MSREAERAGRLEEHRDCTPLGPGRAVGFKEGPADRQRWCCCSQGVSPDHASGFPPNVELWLPLNPRSTASVVRVAPIGTPPARDFATVRISGRTPHRSTANMRPVRPIPVWTSSRIRSAPDASQISRAAGRYSEDATWTPPSPCTASRITAAVSFVTVFRRAPASLYGTCSKPGTRGSNDSRNYRPHVALRAPTLRPCDPATARTPGVVLWHLA